MSPSGALSAGGGDCPNIFSFTWSYCSFVTPCSVWSMPTGIVPPFRVYGRAILRCELGNFFARFVTMRIRVGAVVEAVEVVEDVLFATRSSTIVDEDGNLIRADARLHVTAVVGLCRDLPRDEVDPELGQPLPHLVRVRAPFRLIELHTAP